MEGKDAPVLTVISPPTLSPVTGTSAMAEVAPSRAAITAALSAVMECELLLDMRHHHYWVVDLVCGSRAHVCFDTSVGEIPNTRTVGVRAYSACCGLMNGADDAGARQIYRRAPACIPATRQTPPNRRRKTCGGSDVDLRNRIGQALIPRSRENVFLALRSRREAGSSAAGSSRCGSHGL